MRKTAPAESTRHTWGEAIGVYLHRRVAVMFLLGFSAGLPYQFTASTLQALLTESGVSLEEIGLFGLVAIAYAWKFVWAPAIDGIPIPVLSRVLGHRRAWLLLIQIALGGVIAAMGWIDPATNKLALAAVAVAVAFLSASQDIVIDAFRIESIPEDELAAGTANYNAAYRVAMLVSFTGAVSLVTALEAYGFSKTEAWGWGFVVMASLILIGILGTLLAREDWAAQAPLFQRSAAERFRTAVIEPFSGFLKKDLWWAMLLFVVLFKLGDAFTSELRTTFFLKMGFEKATYAAIQWPAGFFSLLIGGYIGGIMVNRFGLMPSLWAAGIAQMLTNLVFIWPALALPGIAADIGIAQPDGRLALTFAALDGGGLAAWHATAALFGSIAIENFATGIGGVIFIAYMSHLCSDRAYTATQYALLSSLSNQARVVLSAPSGFVASGLGWVWYYVIGTALALPGLALLWWLWNREKRAEARTAQPPLPEGAIEARVVSD
ncbi:MAG: MFS transporter [Alphaproteobacteria bacterium]|nr:MFS transporter [Alphaproteobacteria bacterium]